MSEMSQGETSEAALSPSLRTKRGEGPAYELKFLVTATVAEAVEGWAREYLNPDPHGDDGRYRTTSVYCETPAWDVYHRADGYRRSKFRVRRYGSSEQVFLERKTKRSDQVRKRRNGIPEAELSILTAGTEETEWPALWFSQRVHLRQLRPVCKVGYERRAFLAQTHEGPVRVTFDRHLMGVPTNEWTPTPLESGRELLPDQVLVELKYQEVFPELLRKALDDRFINSQPVV